MPEHVAPAAGGRRRLLLLSFFWPPWGGAGVQRALKLAQAAPSFGWDVTVIASHPAPGDGRDDSLVQSVPADLDVRTAAWPGLHGPGWWQRWKVPDPYRAWQGPATRAARTAIAETRPAALMSTSMPYTAHLAAQTLHAEFGLPWLADLRDPWTDNRFMAHYQGQGPLGWWRRARDGALERAVYAAADAISVTTAPLADLLVTRHGLARQKVIVARNGFDEQDFPAVPTATRAPPAGHGDRPMLFLFAGSMYEGYTIDAFLQAWRALRATHPAADLRLRVVTNPSGLVRQLFSRYPDLQPYIEMVARVPHAEVVQTYAQADVLTLAALDDLSTPGKLFEYVRSGTPVLAWAVPGAEAHAVLRATGAGQTAPHDDPAAGAEVLWQWWQTWRAGRPLAHPDAAAVARLERRAQYAHIFAALDRLVDARTLAPVTHAARADPPP